MINDELMSINLPAETSPRKIETNIDSTFQSAGDAESA